MEVVGEDVPMEIVEDGGGKQGLQSVSMGESISVSLCLSFLTFWLSLEQLNENLSGHSVETEDGSGSKENENSAATYSGVANDDSVSNTDEQLVATPRASPLSSLPPSPDPTSSPPARYRRSTRSRHQKTKLCEIPPCYLVTTAG